MKNRKNPFRQKECLFCKTKRDIIDWKDVSVLGRFLSPWSKIKSAGVTGTCRKHQRRLAQAIKRARFMALLPYVTR